MKKKESIYNRWRSHDFRFVSKMSVGVENVLFPLTTIALQTWEMDHSVWTEAAEYIDEFAQNEDSQEFDVDLYCYEIMEDIC